MDINTKQVRLVLRIIGTLSLGVFFVCKALEIDERYNNIFLFLSLFCYSIVIGYSLVLFLKNSYFKG
ncbi:hypothetical protein Flavo103_36220 [Flavobacterium collinsii]|nr:hypothetical protein Flavo103_36220 [Flavobacterium collinsii]